MSEFNISTPLSEGETRKFRVGDIIYISGTIFTARDEAHKRALEWIAEGRQIPINVEGLAMYHCGPLVQKIGKKWHIISAGPTTSSRMETFEYNFLKHFPVRVVIGKGGMGSKTTEAMKKYGAVYGAFTGGAGALAAESIIEVEDVAWLDLGMSEALWSIRVENFGPIIITIDSYGNNLYKILMKKFEKNIKKIKQEFLNYSY